MVWYSLLKVNSLGPEKLLSKEHFNYFGQNQGKQGSHGYGWRECDGTGRVGVLSGTHYSVNNSYAQWWVYGRIGEGGHNTESKPST